MAEGQQQHGRGPQHQHQHQHHQPQQHLQHQEQMKQQVSHPVLKAVTAAAAGGSLLVLSGLTLSGTVIALAVATPLLVIFSPVLVPAAITVSLVSAGLVTAGGLGVAALSVMSWMYKYLTGEQQPPGTELQLDEAKWRIASKARDVKEIKVHRAE